MNGDPRITEPLEEWLKTEAHKNSRYSCGKCGKRFPTPDAVYAHLDAEHQEDDDG